MKLRRLQVRDFGCIDSADVAFGPGLSVLFGPNDLGKTTLKRAVQAALLLQTGSSAARELVPWGTDRNPAATLTFEIDGRIWRVHKVWSQGTGRKASLEWSNDGQHFELAEEGRAVDGELRRLLGWGVAQPGGRGGTHGLPKSFLRSVLLGEQALPYAVFEDSLDADADDSGRQRLTDALQAMATDEVYKAVLDRTQVRVDEAFTGTGKKKKGKASPFRQVADEIARREETATELERKVAESDAVARRLAELDAERDRCFTARNEAQEALEALQNDLRLRKQREAKKGDVEAARGVIEELERNQAEIARLGEEERTLQAALPKIRERLDAAREAVRRAQSALDRATEAVEQNEQGGTSADEVEQQRLAARRAELQNEQQALQHTEERVQAALLARNQARDTAAHRDEASQAVAATETALAEAQAELQARANDLAMVETARRWLRRDELQASVRHAEVAAREASQLREQAERLRAGAERILTEVDGRGLPDQEVLRQVTDLDEACRLAEARLGGGVSVQLRAEAKLEPTVRIDGGEPSSWSGDDPVQAQREVVLELPTVGTLTVLGGDPDARKAAGQARARRDAEVKPILERAGAADVATLRSACEQASRERAEAEAKRREAENLEHRAAGHDETAKSLDRRSSELHELDREIDTHADAALAERSRGIATEVGDDDTLRARLEDCLAEKEAAAARVETAKTALSEARTDLRVATEQAQQQQERAEQAAAALPEGPDEVSKQTTQRRAAVETELSALEQAQAGLQQQRAGALERARETLQMAQDELTRATDEERSASAALDETTEALSQVRGALQVRREQSSRADPLAAAEAFARLEDELAALPEPSREVTDEEVEQAQAELDEAERALREALSEVRMQEGALQQVGGTVVRERAETAREALEAARRHEAELELEYEGWKVLLETLREAQNEEGHHLGRALGREVGERFGALTAGRYGALQMGPALQAESLQTTAGPQRIESLSEGLKEQLATLLRVSVAEHLGNALILDDHLTQTDPARVAWFRDLLRTASGRGQIIVFTCRPADYLTEHELATATDSDAADAERLHIVDLQRAIERVQTTVRQA